MGHRIARVVVWLSAPGFSPARGWWGNLWSRLAGLPAPRRRAGAWGPVGAQAGQTGSLAGLGSGPPVLLSIRCVRRLRPGLVVGRAGRPNHKVDQHGWQSHASARGGPHAKTARCPRGRDPERTASLRCVLPWRSPGACHAQPTERPTTTDSPVDEPPAWSGGRAHGGATPAPRDSAMRPVRRLAGRLGGSIRRDGPPAF